jgi:uncharacterized protein
MIIPLEEIVRSVTTENPWWETQTIPKRFDEMSRRAYFNPFATLVTNWSINRAVILLGPRRVGKTVMTQHLIKKLIDDGVPARSIMYVSIDTPTYSNQGLQFFINLHLENNKLDNDSKRYVIFDEIQYLADWERHLKVLVDNNPNIRFIASGSAAAALRLASTESGAGRFTEFMLPPLTFEEYLSFIGKSDLVTSDSSTDKSAGFNTSNNMPELNQEFVNYINYGGYPEAVVSEYIRMDAARFIKNDIIDKVLLRDLPQLYGITNIQELNKLFTALAYQTGKEISLETLSQNSGGISKPTIARYIEYLEAAFLIFRVRRVDDCARTFSRDRTFKIFLTNPSMRAALFSPMSADNPAFGHLVETAIFSQWFHSNNLNSLHYARWKRTGRAKENGDHGEIDLVNLTGEMRPHWFIEIKWSDSILRKPECWLAIEEFAAGKKSLKSGVFTSKTVFGEKTIDNLKVRIVPAAIYCHTVGRNTARNRGMRLLETALVSSEVEEDEAE